jgi:PTS system mannose-specific IIC component
VGWTQVLLAGLWGGVVAVERKAFLQAMISRPLASATVMGLLLGDLRAGLFIGMLLELFYLGTANLGASLPENDTVSATGTAAAAATMAAATGAGSTQALWSIAILVFLPLGRAGRVADRMLEGYMARLARVAMASAEAGNLSRAVRQNLWGMWPHFIVYGAVASLCALLGFFIGPLVAQLPLDLLRGLAWAFPAMASVAAALAAQGSHAKRAPLYSGLGALVVILVVILLTLRERR